MLPRFIFCFSSLIILNSFFNDCAAQFRLLWYQGKKIDETTLITSNGQTVRYNRSRHKLQLNTSEYKDLFAIMKRELLKSEQRKKELNQLILKSSEKVLNADFAPHINKAIDETQTRFGILTENTIELPGEIAPLKDSGNAIHEIPAQIKSAYEEVMDYVTKIKTEAIETSPSPPNAGFDYCYLCDLQRQSVYAKDSIAFMKYLEEEKNQLTRSIEVIHLFDLLKSKQLPYDTKRASLMLDDMYNAMQIILNRTGKKLMNSWTQYKNDAAKLPFLNQQLLAYLHSVQLMGLAPAPGFPEFNQIMSASLAAAKALLSKALNENDYRILLNMQWIVGIYRMAELLGMDKSETDKNLMEFIHINRFRVSADALAKMSKNGAIVTLKMNGDNYFQAVPDSNCVLQWSISGDSKMQFNLEEATMESKEGSPKYIGTRKWKSSPASIRLDFCKEERDTVFLYGFSPVEGKEIWTAQGRPVEAGIIRTTFMLCFVDVDRLRANAADPELKAKLEKEIHEKTAKINAAMAGNKDPSTMTPEELAKMSAAMKEAREMLGNMESVSPLSFLFKEQLKNNQKIVLDSRLNGKELFPENTAIAEAIFHLKIEHDPKN